MSGLRCRARVAVLAAVVMPLFLVGCAADRAGKGSPGSLRRTSGEMQAQLAGTALAQGRYSDAERSAREALRVLPERADVFAILGNALLRQGEVAEATEAADRALDLDADDPAALLLAADCATYSGRYSDAERDYERAASAGSPEASLALGVSLLDAGDFDAARTWIDRGAPRGDRGVLTALLLSGHLWGEGQFAAAQQVVTDAIARAPESTALRRRLAFLQFASVGRTGGDVADTPLFEMGANSAGRAVQDDDRLLRAAGLMRSGRAADAAQIYRALIPALDDGVEVRISLGEALLAAGDAVGATAAFQAAAEVERTRPVFSGLGRAELARGRLTEAAAALETAAILEPDHAPTRSLLFFCYLRQGRADEARAEAKRVAHSAPGSDLDITCRDLLERYASDPTSLPAEGS